MEVYTDGSNVSGGIFSKGLNLTIFLRLTNNCSVFQAEVMTINPSITDLQQVISSHHHFHSLIPGK